MILLEFREQVAASRQKEIENQVLSKCLQVETVTSRGEENSED